MPVDEYYPPEERKKRGADSIFGYDKAIGEWRKYLSDGSDGRSFFLTVFSPDEQFVLDAGRDLKRDDPLLIKVLEEMGEKADGSYARIHITEIPDGVDYEIQEYDGQEWIADKHRTW